MWHTTEGAAGLMVSLDHQKKVVFGGEFKMPKRSIDGESRNQNIRLSVSRYLNDYCARVEALSEVGAQKPGWQPTLREHLKSLWWQNAFSRRQCRKWASAVFSLKQANQSLQRWPLTSATLTGRVEIDCTPTTFPLADETFEALQSMLICCAFGFRRDRCDLSFGRERYHPQVGEEGGKLLIYYWYKWDTVWWYL